MRNLDAAKIIPGMTPLSFVSTSESSESRQIDAHLLGIKDFEIQTPLLQIPDLEILLTQSLHFWVNIDILLPVHL
jgi:hypothetical protein